MYVSRAIMRILFIYLYFLFGSLSRKNACGQFKPNGI